MSAAPLRGVVEHQGDLFLEVAEPGLLDTVRLQRPVVGTTVRCASSTLWEWVRDHHPKMIGRTIARSYCICAGCHRPKDALEVMGTLRDRSERPDGFRCAHCEGTETFVFCYAHEWSWTPDEVSIIMKVHHHHARTWWSRQSDSQALCDYHPGPGSSFDVDSQGAEAFDFPGALRGAALQRNQGYLFDDNLACKSCATQLLAETRDKDPVGFYGLLRKARGVEAGTAPERLTHEGISQKPELQSAWDWMNEVIRDQPVEPGEHRAESSDTSELKWFPGTFFFGAAIGAVGWLILDKLIDLPVRIGWIFLGTCFVGMGLAGLWFDRLEAGARDKPENRRTVDL